ncbi:MAG: putative amino acid permease [Frankiales bacterium]|nr:putative amino acid permease [Frankiales bacterium]
MAVAEVDEPDKGLKSGAIGLLSSVVIGVSSTAPGYSLAATLGFVATAVGLQSPAVMLLAFIPMFCIAYAYRELNAIDPDCGTTFTWAARTFGPRTGWMGGWGIIVADIVVMANLAQIAGQYGFLLFGADGLASSTFWTTFVGCLWIAALTYVCYRGIELSARFQFLMLAVEVATLTLFAVVALVKVYSGDAPKGSVHPSLDWLNPFAINSFSALSTGVLLAVFIYWGWDTAVACNEETSDPKRTPGRAAVIATLALLAIYLVVSVACIAFGGIDSIKDQGDVLAVIGNQVLGTTLGKLVIIAVLTSAAASTQTTILPTARTTLSMAAHRAIPNSFARMNPRFQTPTTSTIAMGVASIAFYVGLVLVSGNVLADSILSLGLLIAFYYALTGYACVWQFRRELGRSFKDAWVKGVLPGVGALILTAAFIKSAKDMFASDYGSTSFHGVGGVFLLGIGSLVLGVLVMVGYELKAPEFFRTGPRNDLPETQPQPITQTL